MPVFKIHHITQYSYDRPVRESVNEIRVYPYPAKDMEVLMHELFITGEPDMHVFADYWDNKTGVFNLKEPHQELKIESRLIVRTTATGQITQFNSGRDVLEAEVKDSLQLLELTRPDIIESQPEIDEIMMKIDQPWKSIAGIVQDCGQYIYQYFKYIKGITDIETTVDEILQHRSGVCQDFAHVMLQVLRSMGIPSRYVSGYICPNKNGMRGEGATHAWVEAWIPGHGWAGIDPTNNAWVTNAHIPLAVGRNFSDCSPVRGTFKGPARQQLTVYVSVGYEDGHIFEEMNSVKMQALPTVVPDEPLIEGFAAQQQ
ncbi:MAG: transglutaminase family protein [Chitinophagaceae bacterium]|jgi:transglutaminase-like putative cysteine protease|nr:transglutaminase family protein [Chitinophagaceae bacterium]